MIYCVCWYLNHFSHFLNVNGLQLYFLTFILRGMMRRYECEVPFVFFGSIILYLGVWCSSRVVFFLFLNCFSYF